MEFELSNYQRKYFGLDPVEESWDRIFISKNSFLYFDGDTIKRNIISDENQYQEFQYDEKTKNREILLPKTKKGKEKKLTRATLEKLMPKGVYFVCRLESGIKIANFSTQTTFYSTYLERIKFGCIQGIKKWLDDFIINSKDKYLEEINEFKHAERKNIKVNEGDFFCFKLDRNNYGFGRVLSNITKLRKDFNLPQTHGINNVMGKPLLIKIYHFVSEQKNIPIETLLNLKSIPSQYIFDNIFFYGEYEVLGNVELKPEEIDFPISYGQSTYYNVPDVFLQWGLIHKQKPKSEFHKFLSGENIAFSENNPNHRLHSPFRNDALGFGLSITKSVLIDSINQNSNNAFWEQESIKVKYDLRNPNNQKIKNELFQEFGLKSNLSYWENLNIFNEK